MLCNKNFNTHLQFSVSYFQIIEYYSQGLCRSITGIISGCEVFSSFNAAYDHVCRIDIIIVGLNAPICNPCVMSSNVELNFVSSIIQSGYFLINGFCIYCQLT